MSNGRTSAQLRDLACDCVQASSVTLRQLPDLVKHGRLALLVLAACSKSAPAPEVRLFTEAEIAAYEAALTARIADTAKRSCSRPVVREPGIDAPATTDLIAVAEPTGPVATCLATLAARAGKAKLVELVEQRDPEVVSLAGTCGDALEQAVRKAASHRDACSPYQIGVRRDPTSWMGVVNGAHLLGLHARLTAERGTPAFALAMLLDGASAYRDLGRGHVGMISAMIAVAATNVLMEHALAIITTATLKPDAIDGLITGVDALLASEPAFVDTFHGERHYFELTYGMARLKGPDWAPPGGWPDGVRPATDSEPMTKSPRDEGAIMFAAGEKLAADRDKACPAAASLKTCHDGLAALADAASKVKAPEFGEQLWKDLVKAAGSGDALATAHKIREAIVEIIVNVAHPAFTQYVAKRGAGYARLATFRLHIEIARAGRCPTDAELAAPPYPALLSPTALGDRLTVARKDGGDLEVSPPAWVESKKPPWRISCKPR